MRLSGIATVSLAAVLATGAWAQDTPTTTVAAPAPSASMGGEMDAEAMIGRAVFDRDSQEIGKVEDVVIDPQTGRIGQFMIGSGDPSGAGRKMVAVDMDKVEVTPDHAIRLTGLSRADVAAMPDFTAGSAVSLGGQRPAPEQKPAEQKP